MNAGFGVFLNQWAYSVQQALAATLPFFFAKTVTAAADAVQPTQQNRTVLLAPANGTVGGSTMDWDFRTEYAKNYSVSVQRQVASSTVVEVELSPVGDRRRGQLDGAERARAGPRGDRAAPARPAAGEHHRDSLGRLFDLQRGDVPGRAAPVAGAGVRGVLLALEGD